MSNPIQTVLNAEAAALREIEAEEKAARARLAEARLQARQLEQRNEARTTRVAKRYEARCERDLAARIESLVESSEKEMAQFARLSDSDRSAIVEAVYASLSPLAPLERSEK